jgi:membrane-anchored protein YejM (alkaline phosphatase superfamily)
LNQAHIKLKIKLNTKIINLVVKVKAAAIPFEQTTLSCSVRVAQLICEISSLFILKKEKKKKKNLTKNTSINYLFYR